MKRVLFFCCCFLVIAFSGIAQPVTTPKLEKLWETDTIVNIPESVMYDASHKTLFVSVIEGEPWDKDGVGSVAKLSLDGTNYEKDWVKGLNAPKGMGVNGNKLYVADMNEVLVINIRKASVEKRIALPGAENLNDIIMTPSGIVYASDSKLGKIFKIEDDKATLFMDSVRGINGLSIANGELLVGAGRNFIKINSRNERVPLAVIPQGIDGIEPTLTADYIVSAWAGYLYYVHAGGQVDTLLDLTSSKKNVADIGYDPYKKIIYVPTFSGKTVAAYQLK